MTNPSNFLQNLFLPKRMRVIRILFLNDRLHSCGRDALLNEPNYSILF